MPHTSQKNILITGFILIFLMGVSELSNAALSMGQIQDLFRTEEGKEWVNADSQEQRAFLLDVQSREEFQKEVYFKGKENWRPSTIVEGTLLSAEREEKAPFHIRQSFQREKKIFWEDASEKDQESYIKEYESAEKLRKREEAQYLKEIEREEKLKERERQLEEREFERKKKQKEREEKIKIRELEKKRRDERRKLEQRKRKSEEMLKKIKDLRNKQK